MSTNGAAIGPVIEAATDPVRGFRWRDGAGRSTTLPDLLQDPSHPTAPLVDRHLDALDEVLIAAAGRFGEVLGGGRAPEQTERSQLSELAHTLDRLVHEYTHALEISASPIAIQGGQIVGTAHLLSYRARTVIGTAGPVPLEGELDEPTPGVVPGYAEMAEADPAAPWRGARWIVRTPDGSRLPARLDMLLRDSSGVDRKLTQDTHRQALQTTTSAALAEDVDASVAGGAIDWLLYDWLHANRDDPSSVAVQITRGRLDDAQMIVGAARTSLTLRARLDPTLLDGPPPTGTSARRPPPGSSHDIS